MFVKHLTEFQKGFIKALLEGFNKSFLKFSQNFQTHTHNEIIDKFAKKFEHKLGHSFITAISKNTKKIMGPEKR